MPPLPRGVQRLCLEVPKKVQAGVIAVALELRTEAAALETLMRRYEDTPMSLADACLVPAAARQAKAAQLETLRARTAAIVMRQLISIGRIADCDKSVPLFHFPGHLRGLTA